jgi:biotin operon repressor
MEEYKKPTPVLEHQSGRENEMHGSNSVFCVHSTTPAHKGQEPVLDFLLTGSANALTAGELSRMMGCTRREVSRAVQRARLAAIPVCSSSGHPQGYFLPENRGELERCIARMRHRAGEMGTTIEALEEALNFWDMEAGIWQMKDRE